MMTVIRAFSAAALVLLSATTQAGVWGDEAWGQMYWGDNPVTTPSAPAILSIAADGSDLIVTIADYQPGGDGWSVVTNYTVTCGQATNVASTAGSVRVTGLASETEYSCSVTAANARGDSEPTIQLATTEAELQGLNLILIRSALCASSNPPDNC